MVVRNILSVNIFCENFKRKYTAYVPKGEPKFETKSYWNKRKSFEQYFLSKMILGSVCFSLLTFNYPPGLSTMSRDSYENTSYFLWGKENDKREHLAYDRFRKVSSNK